MILSVVSITWFDCPAKSKSFSAFRILGLPKFIGQNIAANPFPFSLMDFLQNQGHGFGLQANARLALVIKRTLQTAGVKIYLHREASIA